MKLKNAFTVLTVLATVATTGALGADAVEKAEKDYVAATEKIKADADAKLKAAKEALCAKLKFEMGAKTRAGDLDGALKIRERIAQVEAGNIDVVTSKDAPKDVPVQQNNVPKKGKLEKALAIIYAASVDSGEIYINGQRLGIATGNGFKKETIINEGDVVIVKLTHGGDRAWIAFACVIKFANSHIPTALSTWKCFTPKNELLWYQPDSLGELKRPEMAQGEGVKNKVRELSHIDVDAIRASYGNLSYLYLQVSADCIIPTQADTNDPNKK